MKKLLLLVMLASITISGISQNRAVVSKEIQQRSIKMGNQINAPSEFTHTPGLPVYKDTKLADEETIGTTRYDLQTNTSTQNRVHVFDDGTVGGIWTMGLDDAAGYPDRGTGYNYFDGNAWGDAPVERIESVRTGWPSYAPYGENGELVVSHDFTVGSLIYSTRPEKGTGDWEENEFDLDGYQISWNRSVTSGVDNSVMQMLYITFPSGNGGTIYEGMDGALLYSRSSDGGQSWDYEHELLEGMTADEYTGISADNYEWAASKGDNIAFLVGDFWLDLFVMKSADGGDTWTKTVIFEHPYPLNDFTAPTDTPYVSDGAHHLAFDSQNKLHVVFGINRTYSDGSGTWFWFPGVDGVGYWNEDMATFSNDLNALNPYGHPDSELVEDESLIGWSQDLDGSGTIDILDDWGGYGVGLSSQPQIVIDDNDYKYVVYTSVTESYDNGLLNFRHMWARGSWGDAVWGEFVDLTDELVHIFDECAWPSAAAYTDDNFYLTYFTDSEPGNSIQGTLHATTDNNMVFMSVSKNDLIPLDVEESNVPVLAENVSQNYPNPFTGSSFVNVEVSQACSIMLEVTNLTGQVVYTTPERKVNSGTTRFEIKGDNLTPGVYFYSIKTGENSITKKMVIE